MKLEPVVLYACSYFTSVSSSCVNSLAGRLSTASQPSTHWLVRAFHTCMQQNCTRAALSLVNLVSPAVPLIGHSSCQIVCWLVSQHCMYTVLPVCRCTALASLAPLYYCTVPQQATPHCTRARLETKHYTYIVASL